jgi:hypothetical protein
MEGACCQGVSHTGAWWFQQPEYKKKQGRGVAWCGWRAQQLCHVTALLLRFLSINLTGTLGRRGLPVRGGDGPLYKTYKRGGIGRTQPPYGSEDDQQARRGVLVERRVHIHEGDIESWADEKGVDEV